MGVRGVKPETDPAVRYRGQSSTDTCIRDLQCVKDLEYVRGIYTSE